VLSEVTKHTAKRTVAGAASASSKAHVASRWLSQAENSRAAVGRSSALMRDAEPDHRHAVRIGEVPRKRLAHTLLTPYRPAGRGELSWVTATG
jgi:hypothetical protein